MYYLEHCEKVMFRHGVMLPEVVVKQLTGFRSVYGFSKEDAEVINKSGSSRGFSQYTVYSDTWFLDFDNNFQGVKDTLEWIKSKNFGYRLYESGGKGHHIEIPTTEKFDKDLILARTYLFTDIHLYIGYQTQFMIKLASLNYY
jgi:hypothetical protein